MSRKIKFRAYHKVIKQMLDWDELIRYSNDQFHIVQTVNFFEDKELALMQYTGLKDKNGVEIYEGDIIKSADVLSQVVFGEFAGLMAWHVLIKGDEDWALGSGEVLGENEFIEVIGNIYENPELLEVE